MIGIVVQTCENEFSSLVYHKIDGRAIIEHTVEHAQACVQAHKVFLIAPVSERRKLEDVLYRKLSGGRQTIGRFYEESETNLDALYKVAVENGLLYIVRVIGNRSIIPGWYISNFVLSYMKGGLNCYAKTDSEAFRLEMFPFWMIAQLYSSIEDENRSTFESNINTDDVSILSNEGLSFETHGLDLVWKETGQHDLFEYFLNGMDHYDIQDMILEAANGNTEKAIKE